MNDKILKRVQQTELEIFDEIIRICNIHKIEYIIIHGTLIGAVRHKGFIPWDDDIDITMPRLEYEKFKTICKAELNDKYSLIDWDSEPLYYLAHAKIIKNNTIFDMPSTENLDIHKGIYVDIFILEDAKKHKSILQGFQSSIYSLIRGYLWAKVVISSYKNKSLRDKMNQLFVSGFSLKGLKKLLQKIMTMHSNIDAEYYMNFDNNFGKKEQAIAKKYFFPASEMEFENRIVKIPNDWDYILTSKFGDYMKFPPLDERIPKHCATKIVFDLNENN